VNSRCVGEGPRSELEFPHRWACWCYSASMPSPRSHSRAHARPASPAPLARLAKLLAGHRSQVTQQQLKRAQPERFFARVRCFDLACPRCGRVSSTSPHQDPAGRPLERQPSTLGWNPIRCRLVCPACGLRMVIGLVAWILPEGVRGSSQTAPDTAPEALGEAIEVQRAWRAWGAEAHGLLVRAERAERAGLAGGGREFGNLVVAPLLAPLLAASGEPSVPSGEPSLDPLARAPHSPLR
jgi:hypothetical protein